MRPSGCHWDSRGRPASWRLERRVAKRGIAVVPSVPYKQPRWASVAAGARLSFAGCGAVFTRSIS